jgi:hypothetical protein
MLSKLENITISFISEFTMNVRLTLFHFFLGSISPNFFCQAKSCRHTAFGDKFNIQIYQQSLKAKIWSKFAKYVCFLPKAIRHLPKKPPNSKCAKKLIKSAPGLNLIKLLSAYLGA